MSGVAGEESMTKIGKLPKKSSNPKRNRKGSNSVAEIGPGLTISREGPIKSDNEAIEIDKWLKLVESYWQKETRRKA
jgi:hypothetical protein